MHPYRPATVLVVVVMALLACNAIFGLTGSAFDLRTIQLLDAGLDLESRELELLDVLEIGQALLQILTLLSTVVMYCVWVHRANNNARALGAGGMEYTPGWSVGWFFIPIMSLFKPYRAVKEIYQASAPETLEAWGWRGTAVSGLLPAWWAFWIASSLIGNAAARLSFRADSIGENLLATQVNLASNLVDIPAAILALLVVRAIHERQERKFALQQSQGG